MRNNSEDYSISMILGPHVGSVWTTDYINRASRKRFIIGAVYDNNSVYMSCINMGESVAENMRGLRKMRNPSTPLFFELM